MQSIKDVLEQEGSVTGMIVGDEPTKDSQTKKGNRMCVWNVVLDDGRKVDYATFGDRACGNAFADCGDRLEFYLNNGFVNHKKSDGAPPVKSTPKSLAKENGIVTEDDSKARSMCIAYAKDLAVAGKIGLGDIQSTAEGFLSFIHSKQSSTPKPSVGSEWMDKQKTYADGRPYGDKMIMRATEQQAEALLEGVRPLCKNASGDTDLRMGVDIINGMLSKFYYDDPPSNLAVKGNIDFATVKNAITQEDSLTIDWLIKECNK